MKTEKFQRKPFIVDAVRVTEENLAEVALWCQGEIRTEVFVPKPGLVLDREYIKVRVMHPLNEKQSKAFVGDWVLYAGTGYKVYTHKAFQRSFESVFEDDERKHDYLRTAMMASNQIAEKVQSGRNGGKITHAQFDELNSSFEKHAAQKGLSIGG